MWINQGKQSGLAGAYVFTLNLMASIGDSKGVGGGGGMGPFPAENYVLRNLEPGKVVV